MADLSYNYFISPRTEEEREKVIAFFLENGFSHDTNQWDDLTQIRKNYPLNNCRYLSVNLRYKSLTLAAWEYCNPIFYIDKNAKLGFYIDLIKTANGGKTGVKLNGEIIA